MVIDSNRNWPRPEKSPKKKQREQQTSIFGQCIPERLISSYQSGSEKLVVLNGTQHGRILSPIYTFCFARRPTWCFKWASWKASTTYDIFPQIHLPTFSGRCLNYSKEVASRVVLKVNTISYVMQWNPLFQSLEWLDRPKIICRKTTEVECTLPGKPYGS